MILHMLINVKDHSIFMCIGGTRNHTSLPSPPPVILLDPRFRRLEKFKVIQALLACKHRDGRSVCAYVLKMKSHIDRMGKLGVVFSRKLAVDMVLQSLLESYSQFLKGYYMTDHDVTLIDLKYLLIVVEAAMLWHTSQANLFGGSVSRSSIDIGDDNSPKMVSPLKGDKSTKVKKFDHKRKVSSEIVPCVDAKESICFYCQLMGHWKQSCPDYLRDLRDGKVKLYDSTSGSKRKKEA
ncbi:hypothetical protein Lser_V15G17282 [Lactuca serriola]